jgi:uncharacterized protein with PQ loop repeat
MTNQNQKTLVTEIVGTSAGILSVSAGIPQIVSIFKNKNDKISPAFLYILICASSLWLTYAILINVWRGEDESPYRGIALIIFQSINFISLLIIISKIAQLKKN